MMHKYVGDRYNIRGSLATMKVGESTELSEGRESCYRAGQTLGFKFSIKGLENGDFRVTRVR